MRSDSLCLFLTILLSAEPLLASDAFGTMAFGVLVLRNGEILTGSVTKAGDRYVVAQVDGGELRIPTRDVEMHCLDLEEAYVRQRERISGKDASAHLRLADWCLRCGLHAHAADELLAAQSLMPNNPRIVALERRLHSAVRAAQSPDADPTGALPPARRDDTIPLPCQLPDTAIEGFASRIQPLLLNRCGASTCHGARTASDFQLIGPGWGKTITQKYTQRNLAAVMQQLDLTRPEASPLLTVPAKPHAGLRTPVFGERERPQWELLNAWVRTAGRAATQPASVASKSGRLAQTSLSQPVPLPVVGEDSGAIALLEPAGSSVRYNGDESSATLDFRDPFDPERFNRQFLDAQAPQGRDWRRGRE